MINNDTPASGVGVAGVKKQVFFDATSVSSVSATVTVGPDPFYLNAYNLNTGDVITVEAVGGKGSGTAIAIFAPLGTPIILTPSNPQVRIDWPGRYRLVFSGTSVTAIFCEGYAAASSEPTIYALGGGGGGGGGGGFNLAAVNTPTINLTFSGTSSGGTLSASVLRSSDAGNILAQHANGLYANTVITANNLITISGNGTGATPYNIGSTIGTLPFVDLTTPPDGLVSIDSLEDILYCVDSPYQICDVFGGERSTNSQGETCVGFGAGGATLGDFKVAIGHSALANGVTSASGNFLQDVAVGYQAALGVTKNTSLSQASTFIGAQAGSGCTYSAATLIGRGTGAGYVGAHLTAVGDSAASGLTGTDNVVIGNDAGTGPVTTNNSVFIGQASAEGIHAGSGIIAIGTNAGTAANGGLGNLDGCMYIGAFAGSHDTHQNVIIIASDASAATNSTAANQIILGKSSHTELRTAGSIISGGVISASDSRLKKNIQPMESVMGTVDKLNMVNFEWDERKLEAAKLPYREEDMRKQLAGYIAQEIREIMPEAVSKMKGADGEEYFYLHADRMLPYAFKAIKELKARVEELESKVK